MLMHMLRIIDMLTNHRSDNMGSCAQYYDIAPIQKGQSNRINRIVPILLFSASISWDHHIDAL